ncbi:MAG: PEP-CTERM sorting domain-containing protein [Phycisphaerae bacterium]
MYREKKRSCTAAARAAMVLLTIAAAAAAESFDEYFLAGSFTLPAGAGPFDVLADGRVVTLVGGDLYTETAVGSEAFGLPGSLPAGDIPSFGAAFVRVSPGGARIAVGNNGGADFDNFQVGVFSLSGLSGTWYSANHFDAEWYDDDHLALTAGVFGSPSFVSVLDVNSTDAANPVNPVVVGDIGGASAGVTFDDAGNLYTGNGFAIGGPSGTGTIKFFDNADWLAPLGGAEPVDFENDGTLIADLLSAASLGFDAKGHLFVGGGDFGGDLDYAALVHAAAITDALDGLGPADAFDPEQVRRFDPDGANDMNFYAVNFNNVARELYIRAGLTVYRYAIPEPASGLLLAGGVFSMLIHRRRTQCSLRVGDARSHD